MYSVIHKRVFTPLRDLPTRIIEAIDRSSNPTMTFAFTKNPRIFCKCKKNANVNAKKHLHLQKILGFFVNAKVIVGFEE